MARLEVLEGYDTGKSYTLTDEVVLGRGTSTDICIPDNEVSRQHVRLVRQDTCFVIEDLNSANGTALQGIRLEPGTPHYLQNGDEICLGSIRLGFYTDEPVQGQTRHGNAPGSGEGASPQDAFLWSDDDAPSGFAPLAQEAMPPATMTLDAPKILAAIEAGMSQTDTDLQDTLKRFQAMCQVSVFLGAIKDREALPQGIMDCIFDIFPAADRAFVLLKDQHSEQLVPIAVKQRHQPEDPRESLVISRTIVNEVLTHKRSILSCDAMDDARFKSQESIINLALRSMMCAPLLIGDEILGLLQVDTCNAQQMFAADDLQMLTGISTQIAIAMKNTQLVDDFKQLFESLIDLIVTAIDEKSRYTAGHCRRVPILTMLLAEAACKQQEGPFKDFALSTEEQYELKVAALLHDCGKLSTPVHVVDKATKLETIFDRIELIDTRFEIMKRDAEIAMLRQKLAASGAHDGLHATEQDAIDTNIQQLNDDRDFLHTCNIGSESMSDSAQGRVHDIAQQYTWHNAQGMQKPLLSHDEVYNLTVSKGTLTPEEREVINSHAAITVKMLEALPYPHYLRNVPLLAGVHHERMDGTGYPRGYTKEQIPLKGRVIGIADIFEALTAPDRPYKKGKTLMESLCILGQMKQSGYIDPDLFQVFITERIYQTYAESHLAPEQIDDVILSDIPGYTAPSQNDREAAEGEKPAS